VLVFDTETSIDAAQTIRVGAYQERKGGELIEAGVFYDPEAITLEEQATILAFAPNRSMKALTLDEFIEDVLYGFSYDLRATIVGFNLPFDLSRLAKSHGSARGKMRGGFSLQASKDRYRPRIQVKHLSSRAALIQFAAPPRQHTARSGRQRGRRAPVRRGYFVDVIRARYGDDSQKTIGVNYLTSANPLWYTLADCIASKLLTGKAPTVLRAVRFMPKGVQGGLSSMAIAGNPLYSVDPVRDDLFRRLIDLRAEIRAKGRSRPGAAGVALDSQQLALKILANATSYGIYLELNVEELPQRETLRQFNGEGSPSQIQLKKVERPGSHFHPLLGTLITGAARLMLAISERLVVDHGLDWAFCDTDSMAIARPDAMEETEFLSHARSVVDWFSPLNPYVEARSLFKIEDANYGLGLH
jgi:hypothetical protein